MHVKATGSVKKAVEEDLEKEDPPLEQAKSTIKQFKELIKFSLENGGIPERLGLLNILKFGLRISSPDPSKQDEINEWINKDWRKVVKLLLSSSCLFVKLNICFLIIV